MTQLTVLVAEDEALIRLVIVAELEEAGFRVLEASNAGEALVLLTTRPEIRLLFTDVDMPPGMNGLTLAEAVRHRWPPVQIIVTSGMVTPLPNELPKNARFFSKPYNTDSVVSAIRQMAA